jgi:hypothetical protein
MNQADDDDRRALEEFLDVHVIESSCRGDDTRGIE